MITFETKVHREIDVCYQGINLTEFAFMADNQIDNDQIVDTFIRTKHFSYDCLRNCVKNEPNKGYLRQAFNIDKIAISDFKRLSKEETIKFLVDFLNETDWGDDRDEFATLFDSYLEIHNQFGNSDFYVISKEWFDKDDERVLEPESWCYTYYFLIIAVDRDQHLLTLTEWMYD